MPIDNSTTRAGEGDAIQLKDGTILLAYSSFVGDHYDHSPADIAQIRYNPKENKWSERKPLFNRKDFLNLMSC